VTRDEFVRHMRSTRTLYRVAAVLMALNGAGILFVLSVQWWGR